MKRGFPRIVTNNWVGLRNTAIGLQMMVGKLQSLPPESNE